MPAYACVCIQYTQPSFLRVLVSLSAAASCIMHHASCIGRCEPFGNGLGTIWKRFGRGEAKIGMLSTRRLQTHGKNSPMKYDNKTNPVTRHKLKKYHYPCQADFQTVRWISQKTIPKCDTGHAKLRSKHIQNNKPPHNWTWAMRAMGGRADPDIWAVGLGFAGCAWADGRKRKLPEGLGVHGLPTSPTLMEWRKTKLNMGLRVTWRVRHLIKTLFT